MIRVFSFLQRNPSSGILYFRYAIPERFRQHLGKTEIRRSLGTADKRLAIPVAMRLYSEMQDLFKKLETGPPMRKAKKQDKPDFGVLQKIVLDELELPSGVKAKGVVIDTGDDIKDERIFRELLGNVGTSSTATATNVADSAQLVMVAKKYQAEKVAEGSWTQNTADEYAALYELLFQVIGNVEISTVTHKDAREFKDCLLKLPPNSGKGKFSGKTVKQILAMNPTERMSAVTVNGKLQRVSSLFLWAVRHGYATLNPFDGLKLKENRRAQDQREKFNADDLQKIFNPATFTLDKLRQPFKYWLPLLGLFTGGRAQELAQLRPQDVFNEDGIPAIRIVEKAGRLKTMASQRVVPLHPRLVELGFLEYVESIRASGHERLFPEAHDTVNGPGDKLSRWFAVHRKNLSIGQIKKGDGNPSKCFHSFRHCFADGLKQAGADPLKIAQLLGHTDKNISTARYGKDYPVSALYETVCLLDFDLKLTNPLTKCLQNQRPEAEPSPDRCISTNQNNSCSDSQSEQHQEPPGPSAEEKERYEQGKFHIVELTRNPGYDTFHGRATENWTDYFKFQSWPGGIDWVRIDGEFRDYDHFAGVFGKFDPYCAFVEKPMLSKLNYEAISKLKSHYMKD